MPRFFINIRLSQYVKERFFVQRVVAEIAKGLGFTAGGITFEKSVE